MSIEEMVMRKLIKLMFSVGRYCVIPDRIFPTSILILVRNDYNSNLFRSLK